MPDYDDRLKKLEDEAFDRAVMKATAQVSSNLAKIHRVRLVTQTAVVVALVTASISIALILNFQSQANTNLKHDSAYVCNVVKEVSGTMGDFITSDANLRIEQTKESITGSIAKGFEKIFSKSELFKLAARSNAQSLAVANRWLHVDAPRLDTLAKTNCNIR